MLEVTVNKKVVLEIKKVKLERTWLFFFLTVIILSTKVLEILF